MSIGRSQAALVWAKTRLFDGCDKLTEIHVKARGIKALPERLFEECTSVTKVMLNNKRVRLSKPKP